MTSTARRDVNRNEAQNSSATPGEAFVGSGGDLGGVLARILAILLLVAPFVGLAILVGQLGEAPPELDPVPQPALAPVGQRIDTSEMSVVIEVAMDPPALIRSPQGFDGIVGSIQVRPGDVLLTGSPVATVSGIERIAAYTTEPFYRELSVGSAGADVTALQEVLAALSYFDSQPDGHFGDSTAAAVRRLEDDLGVQRPTGVFSPGFVLWIPEEEFTVVDSMLAPGSPAPQPGEPILRGVTPVSGAALLSEEGGPFEFPGGNYEVVVGNVDLGLIVGTRLSQAQIDRLIEATLAGRVVPEPEANDPVNDPGGLRPQAVARYSARAVSPRPVERHFVPAGAVIGDAEGDAQCLFIANSTGYDSFATRVIDGSFGVVVIDPAPQGDDVLVLANPLDVLEHPSCN